MEIRVVDEEREEKKYLLCFWKTDKLSREKWPIRFEL